MKRRLLLRSIVAIPAAAVLPAAAPQQEQTAARDQGLPAGPPLVPPGIEETPNTPVTPADQTADTRIHTFNAEQLAALSKLGELLVPPFNGNPGAREAGAAEFLDFLVGSSPPSRIALYRNGLDTLNQRSQQQFAVPFERVTPAQAAELLAPLRQPWAYPDASAHPFTAFLLAAKDDLLRATLNSKPYIDAVSQTRRPRNASNFYWYPIS